MDIQNLKEIQAFFDSDYAPSKRYSYDLSLSENPLGHSASIVDTLMKEVKGLEHYPDKLNLRLKKALSDAHNVKPESIYIGTGVTGIIQDCCKILVKSGQHILLPESTFPGPIFLQCKVHVTPRPLLYFYQTQTTQQEY